jgi:hypothetical protein
MSRQKTWGACVLGTLVVASVSAQDAPTGTGSPAKGEITAQRLEELKRAAESYRIVLDSDPARSAEFRSEPILRWTNPLRKTDDGAVFLWIERGRPAAVASFYRYRAPEDELLHEDHEFQSLATTGLRATRNGQVAWSPKTAGITLAPIPGAPDPAATAPERLRQMRALAREFHAFFDLPENQSELRLLTQPLYRYETNRPDLIDGALFAFVQTTDPEVLLLLEARPIDGKAAWHYALARMSMVNLRARHKDQSVWRVDWEPKFGDISLPYTTLPGSGPGR